MQLKSRGISITVVCFASRRLHLGFLQDYAFCPREIQRYSPASLRLDLLHPFSFPKNTSFRLSKRYFLLRRQIYLVRNFYAKSVQKVLKKRERIVSIPVSLKVFTLLHCRQQTFINTKPGRLFSVSICQETKFGPILKTEVESDHVEVQKMFVTMIALE